MTLCGTYHDFQDAIEAWGRQGFPGQQHLVVADELTGLAHQTPELEKFLNRFYELLRYIDSGGPMAVLMIGNPVPEELARRCRHVRLGPLSVEDLDKLISQWRNWMGLELLRETGGPARRLETLPTLLGADGRPLSANSGAFRHIRVDLSCANEELLRLVRERPEEMYRMRPAEVENFVAALLARMGYQVTRTPLTHDGGVDVVAVRKAGLGSFLGLVQCKRWRPDRAVGISVVRELYGVVEAERATFASLFTTSYFSRESLDFQERFIHRISLKDYNTIKAMLTEISR